MPRKKIVPKVKYVHVKDPNQSALDAAFDYLFEKVVEQASKKNKPAK